MSLSGSLSESLMSSCFYAVNTNDTSVYDLICIDTSVTGISVVEGAVDAVVAASAAESIGGDLDQVWVLICGVLVFFMQTGFTLLEAGTVKAANVQNILFKNLMDACIGAISFFIIGYTVAYGDPSSPSANGFIGTDDFFIESGDYISWFFQWAFAATAATIVSGAVAERCKIEGYFVYTLVISIWIYPVVVHWVWSATGWLSAFNEDPVVFAGAMDFAGSGVVHMVGGFSGLMGAIALGPRAGRFDAGTRTLEAQHHFEFGNSVPFQVLGTLILWVGWYGFNCGSTLAAQGAMHLASKVAVTTTLAAAAGGITCAAIARKRSGAWHLPRVCNGILAALVSITASCSVVSPGVSILIGIVGGCVYYAASTLVAYFKVDDPLDAFAVHGCGGVWGVLSAGVFGTSKNIEFGLYSSALYADTSHGQRFVTQLCLVAVVAVWTIVNAGALFAVLSYFNVLRVSEEVEAAGIDMHEHGGSMIAMSRVYRTDKKGEISASEREKNLQTPGNVLPQSSNDDAEPEKTDDADIP